MADPQLVEQTDEEYMERRNARKSTFAPPAELQRGASLSFLPPPPPPKSKSRPSTANPAGRAARAPKHRPAPAAPGWGSANPL